LGLVTLLSCALVGPSLGAPLAAQQALSESTARQQQRAAGLWPAPSAAEPAGSPPAVAFGTPDTYRWEGAIVGVAIGALMFGSMTANACGDGCGLQTAEGAFLGGIFGGFSGMLIGNLFHKHASTGEKEGATDG